MHTSRSAALGWIAVVLVTTRPAAAQGPPTEPIRIRYAAHDGCPSEQVFAREVRARTARARIAEAGETARLFDVSVTAAGTTSHGKLVIREPGGGSSVREVSGRGCAEVVSALALIAALAIDPRASTAPEPVEPPPSPEPLPPPPVDPEPPGEPFALPSAAPRGKTIGTSPDRSEPWPPLPPPLPAWVPRDAVPPPGYRPGLGAAVLSVGAVAPSMSTGAGVFAELGVADDENILSPAFRLSVAHAASGSVATDVGTASFRWTVARIDACPVRIGDGPLDARACLTFDAGVLEGTGERSETRPWLAPGSAVRVGWVIVEPVWIEAQGGLNLPLVRDTFKFDSPKTKPQGTPIHTTPSVGGIVGVGVGVRF